MFNYGDYQNQREIEYLREENKRLEKKVADLELMNFDGRALALDLAEKLNNETKPKENENDTQNST